MNKKLLFGIMSLAALASCSTDDFESQKVAQQEVSPVTFEVINSDNAVTRASMDGSTLKWSAKDGDLFTLYHGAAYATPAAVTGYENATYTAAAEEGKAATLTTPSMIKAGSAIMVWPVDTAFNITSADNLFVKIPQVLKPKTTEEPNEGIENKIPYASDLIQIDAYAPYSEAGPGIPTAYRTAGKDRKYPIYMRPLAAQLTINADYNKTDETLASLYTGDDAITEISVTSIDLLTTPGGGTTDFTIESNITFAAPVAPQGTNWNTVANNTWKQVTSLNRATPKTSVDKLTTKVADNKGGKFLFLPQPKMTPGTGVADAGIVVNTTYGKVVIADPAGLNVHGTKYSALEWQNAWYRYLPAAQKITVATAEENVSEATPNADGLYKTVALNPALGMEQTINYMGDYTAKTGSKVVGEYMGCSLNRSVVVNLEHLDMSDLHIKTDKQLRDAARVWQKMGLPSVTVHLDGNSFNQFFISQQTIKKINEINLATVGSGKLFSVTPCNTPGEVCNEIVISGGDKIEDLTFITDEDKTADVVLQSDFTWKWDGSIKVHTTGLVSTGIASIINRGTLENAEDKILNIVENNAPTYTPINIKVKNDVPGKWNITAGRIRVQNQIENFGTVTISSGAQFIEDGAKHGAAAEFINNALTKEKRFNSDGVERIGKVINSGVFATIGGGVINNYSLIEHADEDAKTYITHNQLGGAFGTNFTANTNMMGRINLPFGNKDEDNISISAVSTPATMEGFVSVTITAGNAPSTSLSFSAVGEFVNSLIVNGGINEIADLPSQIKYVEVATDKEIAWNLTSPGKTANYNGLTILSDVNIKLGTTVNAAVTYLGAEMYVGGTFNKAGTDWDGYYGDTSTRVAEHYITFK